jgi:tRNA G10  N-methylase Trm11
MVRDFGLKKIRMQGHRHGRTLTCPYCGKLVRVTLVTHLRKRHPKEWDAWTEEFVRLYNETNDLKRVMRAFSNADGQPILSWTVIDRELKRRLEQTESSVKFLEKQNVPRWGPIESEYKRFETTVWDIPRRGSWGVHQATYRGNWAPQVPRALIEYYTKPGDKVLDPFVGGGTTLLECWDLGRHAFGYDVSELALELTRARLDEFSRRAGRESLFGLPDVQVHVARGDARSLVEIDNEDIDFVCTHPPYGNALKYSHNEENDLSLIDDPVVFMDELTKAGRLRS